jgi:hypothetical protein
MVIRDMQITGDVLLVSAATLVRRNVGIPSDEQISVAAAAAIQRQGTRETKCSRQGFGVGTTRPIR